MTPFSWRIGQFFLFMGLLALFVFLVSLQAGSPSLAYCLFGLFFIIIGAFGLWRGRRIEIPPDERFQTVRRLRSKRRRR